MSLKQLHIGKKRGKKPTARGVDGEEMGVAQGNVQGAIFDLQFAHKTPDLHRNKGLAATCRTAVLCDDSFNGGAIFPKKRAKRSGQERRKRSSGSSRETGGFRKQPGDRMVQDGGEDAHAIAGMTEAHGSAGASSMA